MRIPQPSPQPTAGFTLIELVISSALMALILSSAYACWSAGLASQKMIEPRLEALQKARVAMELMAADLRAACPLSREFPFVGAQRKLGEMEAGNLDFATHHYTPRRPHEGDYCQTSYFLEPQPGTGRHSLWRRRNPMIGFDPFSGGRREEIATGLLGMQFSYFDGLEWYDTWGDTTGQGKAQYALRVSGNAEGLPEAVRITLVFAPDPPSRPADAESPNRRAEPPLVFQTVARLNLAAAAAASSSSGETGTAASATPSQAPAAGGP